MANQLLYLEIIRTLSEHDDMPIEMLALKIRITPSNVLPYLQKLEQIHVVKLDHSRKRVRLSQPAHVPTMTELYSLAG